MITPRTDWMERIKKASPLLCKTCKSNKPARYPANEECEWCIKRKEKASHDGEADR